MTISKTHGFIALVLTLWASLGAAHALDVPKLASYVNDSAGLFAPGERDALVAKLKQYQDKSGHQFVFLGIPSLDGESIDEYANRTFHTWGLGDKKRDDGLLFVIAKKERKWRIEVGYGLEGTLPDATVNRIFREQAAKPLKGNDFATGVRNTFDALIQTTSAADATQTPAASQQTAAASTHGAGLWISGGFLGLLGFGLFAWGRRAKHRREEEEARRREGMRALERARQRQSYAPAPAAKQEPARAYQRATPTDPVAAPVVVVTRRDDDDPPRRRDSSPPGGIDISPSTFDIPTGGGGDSGGGGASGDF